MCLGEFSGGAQKYGRAPRFLGARLGEFCFLGGRVDFGRAGAPKIFWASRGSGRNSKTNLSTRLKKYTNNSCLMILCDPQDSMMVVFEFSYIK